MTNPEDDLIQSARLIKENPTLSKRVHEMVMHIQEVGEENVTAADKEKIFQLWEEIKAYVRENY